MTHEKRAWREHRPPGQVTRGKTAHNRLRRVDNYLLIQERPLLRRQDGDFAGSLFVDLGYGAEPFTTLESAARLRWANPDLRVLGVEIDAERVAAANPTLSRSPSFAGAVSICPCGRVSGCGCCERSTSCANIRNPR